MAIYNKYYAEENYFGKSYPELVSYINEFGRECKILDLGCGQGRDVLSFGRLGFEVKGLDISDVGINQLNDVAKAEGLNVIGVVEDYKFVDYINQYDIVLMNSMFHFYKNDIVEETQSIELIMNKMKIGSSMILIVQENKDRVNHLRKILGVSNFQIQHEESFIYQEFNSTFYMISVKKI